MIIQIKVYPNSGREEIVRISENEYKVYLKKPAENNKANVELIKMLKRYFKKHSEQKNDLFCSASSKPQYKTNGFEDIKIIKGLKIRNKIIKIGGN